MRRSHWVYRGSTSAPKVVEERVCDSSSELWGGLGNYDVARKVVKGVPRIPQRYYIFENARGLLSTAVDNQGVIQGLGL